MLISSFWIPRYTSYVLFSPFIKEFSYLTWKLKLRLAFTAFYRSSIVAFWSVLAGLCTCFSTSTLLKRPGPCDREMNRVVHGISLPILRLLMCYSGFLDEEQLLGRQYSSASVSTLEDGKRMASAACQWYGSPVFGVTFSLRPNESIILRFDWWEWAKWGFLVYDKGL